MLKLIIFVIFTIDLPKFLYYTYTEHFFRRKTMNRQKKIATINDISCIGKCSLTVALPMLSAAGFETCPVPTAVLSTHTGDFTGYTFHDLTGEMRPIFEHWKTLGSEFDAVLTGYLGSSEQLDFTEEFIEYYKRNCLILVDPVMGDHGSLYNGFDLDFVKGMANLCRKADLIVPNITEACLLTSTPYLGNTQTKEHIETLLNSLSNITDADIVLTGVSFNEEEIGVAVYQKGKITYIQNKKYDVLFHGTGDVFACTLLSALMLGFDLENASEKAIKFVITCIKKTIETVGRKHYGVNFELCIPDFLNLMQIK